MTQRFQKCIIILVRTSLFAIAIPFLFYVETANSGDWGRRQVERIRASQRSGVSQSTRASARQTHGGVTCPDGQCGNPSLRSRTTRLSVSSPLSIGASRTLVNLYRSCDAATPVGDLVISDGGRVRLSYDDANRNHFLYTGDSTRVSGIDTVRSIRTVQYNGRTIKGGPRVVASGPYSKHVANAQCADPVVNGRSVDAQSTPVIFQNGATLGYKPGQGLNPYGCVSSPTNALCNMRPSSEPAIALDCMEFVTTSMASACLKFTTDDNFKQAGAKFLKGNLYVSNSNVHNAIRGSNSCFDRINMNNANFLKEGDLIFGKEKPNHAVIISDVTDPSDPLGISAVVRSRRSCSSITPMDFNFSLAQSTSVASIGPSKIRAADFFCFHNRTIHKNNGLRCGRGRSGVNFEVPFPLEDLRARAIQICNHMKNGGTLPPPSISENYNFVRHKGTSECKMSGSECPNVIGDECADDVCRIGRGA